jgi:transcriptional regulator with GAF, ATPase, and Fis domain
MDQEISRLSTEQWDFLSTLYIFGGSLPIDIAGSLAPIAPGPFFDLSGRNNHPCLIYESEKDVYKIVPELPPEIIGRLDALSTPERVNRILNQLLDFRLIDKMDTQAIEIMLTRINDEEKAAQIEIQLGRKLFEKKEFTAAANFLVSAAGRLYPIAEKSESFSRLFISVISEFIEIWIIAGKKMHEPINYLNRAIVLSKNLGDKRSRALLYLQLSHFLELIGKYEEMWDIFSKGYQAVMELGDDDILLRTAGVLGTNFFHQGLFAKAIEHFEKITLYDSHYLSNLSKRHQPFRNIYEYGLALIFSGRFHEAAGYLYFQYTRAKENSDPYNALFSQNMLGVELLMIKNIDGAKKIFNRALKAALHMDNLHLLYILQINLAYIHFLEGNFERARDTVSEISRTGQKLGAIHYPIAGYILEMLFELEQLGFTPDPQFNYKDRVKMILKGVNTHFKGIVLRLEALSMQRRNQCGPEVEEYLSKSERYLKLSGDLIQLGKTRLEMIRMSLKNNRIKNAARLAQMAFDDFGDYTHLFFPQEFMYLLQGKKGSDAERLWQERYRKSLLVYDCISTGENSGKIKFKALSVICSMAKAERAAIVRFDSDGKMDFSKVLAYNITSSELKSTRFESSRILIQQAHSSHKLTIWRNNESSNKNFFAIKSILCLLVNADETESAVLYLDNLFLDDRYEAADPELFKKIFRQAIDNCQHTSKSQVGRRTRDFPVYKNATATYPDALLFENPIMAELIAEADKAASFDAVILITGETGTGKELLARRIHHVSSRCPQAFVVVDLTSIPDNLLESELFGYEKGAFTGADGFKPGRIELAHQGTLFLDEIGEITPAFQVKLLRTLQEKIVMRVGGTQLLPVDFRLIAATNRDLKEEVAAGNFREDLFYRLNVFPIRLPPLRERQGDILLIARYFLSRFAKKLNRSPIHMTSEDESWLLAYAWPGNVRELRNVIERAVILSSNGMLNLNMINNTVAVPVHQRLPAVGHLPLKTEADLISEGEFPALDEIQRRYIQRVLAKTNGKISGKGGAAEILKMKYSTLYAKMKKLGLH